MARAPAGLPNGTRISDHVTLGVLTTTVPTAMIDAVLAATGRQSRRQRQLPARLVVYYVMALALYAQASYGEVLRCLLEGVRWLRLRGADVASADKSAITKARIRLGPDPLRQLFERVARPCAEPGTPGAWYQGHRLVSLDGTTIDLPDTPELEERFGRLARCQQLPAAAPAHSYRDRHACHLCVHLRPLRRQRGRAGPGAHAAVAAGDAVPGRPGLCWF